jgi:hypothetical protein
MVLGMATGSIMISGRDDHYFGDLKALVTLNKFYYRKFFVVVQAIFMVEKPNSHNSE